MFSAALLMVLAFWAFDSASASDVPCNYGDIEYDGYCYNFVNNRVLYPDAQAYCATHGGSVVRIKGPGDGRWLVSIAATEFHATYGNFWIGLHKEKDQFVWDDGAEVTYLNWAPGSPFSGYDHVGARLSDAKWVTVLSSQSLPFICAYEKGSNGKLPTTPVVTQSARGICDGADLLLDHRCYFFNPTQLPYDEAVEQCRATGKTLAVFDNIGQINFVTATAISRFSMTYGTFWIGLQLNTSDRQWYWPDGSKDTLKYWSSGYPFQHESVVSQQVSTGRWKTNEKTTRLPTVCSGYVE